MPKIRISLVAQQVKDVVIAAAHVAALARELPYAMGATKKKKKKIPKKKKNEIHIKDYKGHQLY